MKLEQFYLYDDDPKVTLTAYILDDSPEMLCGKKRPAFLICPGGAYMFNSDREAEPAAIRLPPWAITLLYCGTRCIPTAESHFRFLADLLPMKKAYFPDPCVRSAWP